MKHKKLLAFMIIVSTLLVCCTMSISASDIWNGDAKEYMIDGTLFVYLDNEHQVNLDLNIYYAYINYDDIGIFYIVRKIDDEGTYEIYSETEGTDEVNLNDYEVTINDLLYSYWNKVEGTFPIINTNKIGGAKNVFDIATTTTQNTFSYLMYGIWDPNTGITLWGWLIIVGFSLITTFNIIKMIRNSL